MRYNIARVRYGFLTDINISLDEYTSVISTFLKSKDNTFEQVPELKVYRLDNLRHQTTRRPVKMIFPIAPSSDEVESASLRLLLPPQQNDSSVIKVQVNQILGTRRRRALQENVLYLSRYSPKWCDFDISEAFTSWSEGRKNLGLEFVCVGCRNNLNPQVAAITSLVHTLQRRAKRALHRPNRRKSECTARTKKGNKTKCCRHDMRVTFKELGFPQLDLVVEPKFYDAGYCHGLCPPNYSLATNHSRIQGLMHQITKSIGTKDKKNSVPRTCCAPSKLESIELILVNKDEPTKLVIDKWENMRVLECACS